MSTDRHMEHRRVLKPDFLDQNFVASAQRNHPRTTNALLLLPQRLLGSALSVDGSLAADGDVMQSSPGNKAFRVVGATGLYVHRQHLQCRTRIQPQVDPTGQ